MDKGLRTRQHGPSSSSPVRAGSPLAIFCRWLAVRWPLAGWLAGWRAGSPLAGGLARRWLAGWLAGSPLAGWLARRWLAGWLAVGWLNKKAADGKTRGGNLATEIFQHISVNLIIKNSR